MRQVGERTKIGVHEFNDRPVSVHSLSKRFPNEMPFVDDLVGRTEFAKGLLGKLRDVVGGAGLRGSRGILKELRVRVDQWKFQSTLSSSTRQQVMDKQDPQRLPLLSMPRPKILPVDPPRGLWWWDRGPSPRG
jgi:hypothetical protein